VRTVPLSYSSTVKKVKKLKSPQIVCVVAEVRYFEILFDTGIHNVIHIHNSVMWD
jgi:hypothetical protein